MATYIVGALVILAVVLIIKKMIKDKRNGVGCSGCSGCSGHCSCESSKKEW